MPIRRSRPRRSTPFCATLLAAVALLLLLALPAAAQAPMDGAAEPPSEGGASEPEAEGTPQDRDGDGCNNAQRGGRGGPIQCEDPENPGKLNPGSPDADDSDPTIQEGSCEIATFDVCGPAITIVKGILDKAWTWIVGITESIAEWVMDTAFTLPSMEGELLGKYDSMVDTVKPAIIVGILLLALGMMLSPSNVGAQQAILSGLPKIAFVALSLAFFPEFVRMMTDITGSLGSAFGDQAEVGAAFGLILDAAGTFGIAASVFTANPGVGAIVAGLTVLPLLLLFVIIFGVGILIDFLFAVLVMLGPICLVCWPIPGLQTIAVVWFRSIMACFLIPVLFSIEAAVGSWIVASPELLTNADGAAGDFQVVLGTICLILLMMIMYATPKKVLDWAFGAALGGSFSFKGAKNAVQSFSQELVKGATTAAAPGSGVASALASGGRSKDRGLAGALAGAAGGAVGAKLGGAASNLNLKDAVGHGPGGAGGLIGTGKRGMRDNQTDPVSAAKDAMSNSGAKQKEQPNKEGQSKPNPAAGRQAGLAGASKLQDASAGKDSATDKALPKGAAAASAAFQKGAAGEQAPNRFAQAKAAHQAATSNASSADSPRPTQGTTNGTEGAADINSAAQSGGLSAEEPMPTNAGVEEGGLAAASGTSQAQDPHAQDPQAAQQSWNDHLARNGFGNDVGDAIAADAQESGRLAADAGYQQSSQTAAAASERQAAGIQAGGEALVQQARDLPGVHNEGPGDMNRQGEAMIAQAAQIRADIPETAHSAGQRGAEKAAEQAEGVYAGAAAQMGADQRAEAVRPVARMEAEAAHNDALNTADADRQVYDEATQALAGTGGTPEDDAAILGPLEQQMNASRAAAESWAPGGDASNNHIDSRVNGAHREEYDALYTRATGSEAKPGSHGYARSNPPGPPTFGGGTIGRGQPAKTAFGPDHDGSRPQWSPHEGRA